MDNSISFTGKLRIRDYTQDFERTFKTTKAQDNQLFKAAEELCEEGNLKVLTHDAVQKYHKLLETITGLSLTNLKYDKGFYRMPDNIVYADRFIRPWAGIHVDLQV